MRKINTRKKCYSNYNVTPTHLAALNSNPDIFKYFLELGNETYIVDDLMRKPIHFAACNISSGPLNLLLEKGIDCRDFDKLKKSPLMYASMYGRTENIEIMCKHVE